MKKGPGVGSSVRVAVALVFTSLLAGVLAGCLAPGLGDACVQPQPVDVLTPWVSDQYMETDPTQPWDTLVLAENLGADENWFRYETTPDSWTTSTTRLGESADTAFDLVRVDPRGDSEGNLTLRWGNADFAAGCRSGNQASLSWDLMEPRDAAAARPGQGVHVYTAGFWENGTLFYTNIRAVHESPWPRAAWYEWEGDAPLPVYVYEQDREERGPLWSATTAGTPLGAPTGNLTLWDYFTTIPGFNNALKDLSLNTVRVVRLAPEEAYTRSGNEEHPLYGDALVFYIKVLDVEDLPCPDVRPCVTGLVRLPSKG